MPDVTIGSCMRKRRYVTEAYAKKVAAACEAARGRPLRVYWCGCGGWHLTSLGARNLVLANPKPPQPEPPSQQELPSVYEARRLEALERRYGFKS